MDIKDEVKGIASQEAKLSMPIWKWAAIATGAVIVFLAVAFCVCAIR